MTAERIEELKEWATELYGKCIGSSQVYEACNYDSVLTLLDDYEKARPLLSAIGEARIYWDNKYTPITFSLDSAEVVLGQAIEYASKNREGEGR